MTPGCQFRYLPRPEATDNSEQMWFPHPTGKLQLYAEAGIREYRVAHLVDGVDGIVEVYTDVGPGTAKYRAARIVKRGDTMQLPAGATPKGYPALGAEISVNGILGPETKA
jgi:hypothetical protein